MRNKPTYSEFKRYETNGFVRTKDGRYFKVERTKTVKRISSALIWVVFILYMAISFLGVFMLHWSNLLMDFTLLYFASIYLIGRINFSLTHFSPVLKDSQDFIIVQRMLFNNPVRRRIVHAIFSILIIFIFLNSYCVMFLRSTLSPGGGIVSAFVEYSEYDMMYTDSILLDEIPSTEYIEVTIIKTPEIAEFNLNGQPIPTKDIHIFAPIQLIWEEDYFRSEYHMRLRVVTSASVLTLDCDNLHKEWTFITGAE